jgi:hypothetical protein
MLKVTTWKTNQGSSQENQLEYPNKMYGEALKDTTLA